MRRSSLTGTGFAFRRACRTAREQLTKEQAHADAPMILPAFLANWSYQIPNFILAVIMYTLVGRLLMSLFLPPDSPNYILRFFRLLTDPVVRAVRLVTPEAVPLAALVAFSIVWVFALRVALLFAFAHMGLLPTAPV